MVMKSQPKPQPEPDAAAAQSDAAANDAVPPLLPERSNDLSLEDADLPPALSVAPEQDEAAALLPDDDVVPSRSPSPRWLLFSLGLCAAVSSLAVGAFIWLMSIPPAPKCDQISNFSPDRERLYCAQQSAASGDLPELLAGMDTLGEWTAEHPLYNEAQDWLADWSDAVLAIARTKMYDSDIEGAIELANQIPPTSPMYDDAQAAIGDWQAIWDSGKYIYDKAQTAIRAKDWNAASQHILDLGKVNNDYWRLHQTAALSQQVQVEKQAYAALTRARNQVTSGNPADLSAAVTAVSQIDRSTYTWWDAQADMNKWSEALLAVGLQKWQAGRLDEAIALGQRVALNPNLTGTGTDLVKLAQARKHAFGSGSQWTASPKHLWSLMQAIALARQIQPTSKYYAQAQSSLKSWELQLQDLTQLQAAQVAADLGQKPMLKYAIAQAQQIEPGRPRRLQAQTLIAHWNQEIERLEDEPHLVRARTLAEQGTISSLKAAIAQASKVHLGRALRPEAQGLIFVWNQDIQTIEDQPILIQARALAQQGDLTGAIAQASRIQRGRALYWEAQGAIATWQAEIRAAEEARRQRELDALTPEEPEVEPSPTDKETFDVRPLNPLDELVEQRPNRGAPVQDFYQPKPSALELSPGAVVTPNYEPAPPPPPMPQTPEATPFPSPSSLSTPAPFPTPNLPAAVEAAPPQPEVPVEQGVTPTEQLQSNTPAAAPAF